MPSGRGGLKVDKHHELRQVMGELIQVRSACDHWLNGGVVLREDIVQFAQASGAILGALEPILDERHAADLASEDRRDG